MDVISSSIEPSKKLHAFYTLLDFQKGTASFLTGPDHPLQMAVAHFPPKNHTFNGPHKHHHWKREIHTTSEIFIVHQGALKISCYDLDDSFISSRTLLPGDVYVYFDGGHGVEVMDEKTVFYELRNGPYKDQKTDKEFYTQPPGK
jgi:hypothetical protein